MDVSVPEISSACYLEMEAHSKPQSDFQCTLADNSYNQFKHLMCEGGDSENAHPYKEEIEGLLKTLKTEFVELFDVEVTKIENTECVWVKTTYQLEELAEVLSKERVFGVDTEQHGFRSFLGFTCLIQISTTSKDYLVDAIALHDVMGILRPVFADPRICKVFHGAGNDILWLQRDFHIYVVNLFDTAKASEVLWKEGTKSFAYLIEKYFEVSKDKALQTGDWRRRPLSVEQVRYAQTDSHYLVPVAHRLVSDLKSNSIDLVLDTIHRSNVLCLELYKKDTKEAYLGESAAASIVSRLVNPERFHYNVCDTTLPCSCLSKFGRIVRRLCAWREIMARVHDESLSFILSDLAIGEIAASLLATETDVHSTICSADKSMHPSPVVCSHFKDFGRLISLDSSTEDDDFGRTVLQWHLGSNENCPLSRYNHNLLSGTIPKLSNRPVLNPGGSRAKRKNMFDVKAEKEKDVKVEMVEYGKVYDSERQLLWKGNQSSAIECSSRYNGKVDEVYSIRRSRFTIIILPGHEDGCNEQKQKVCARCNKSSENENELKCYQIMPHCYEVWFPVSSKFYQETKLLCDDCHAIVSAAARECKQQIAREFEIALGLVKVSSFVRGLAITSLVDGGSVPRSRLEVMAKRVNMDYELQCKAKGREVRIKDLEQVAVATLKKLKRKLVSSKKVKGDFFFECNHKSEGLAFSLECKDCKQESEHGKFVVSYIYAKEGRRGLFIFWQRWKVFMDALVNSVGV